MDVVVVLSLIRAVRSEGRHNTDNDSRSRSTCEFHEVHRRLQGAAEAIIRTYVMSDWL